MDEHIKWKAGNLCGWDARAGSVKRVASAVGEGSVVISDVHRYLAKHTTWPPQTEVVRLS